MRGKTLPKEKNIPVSPLHPSKSLFSKIAVVYPKSHEEKNIF
jgi:hypothetical protein